MSGNEEGDGEYEDGPKDTIEVRGPENLINRYKLDLLQLYFESQKDMNGSITHISFDAANAVVVIKFDSEQVAQRITECPNHVLKGESLNVKLRQNPNIHSRLAQTTHAASIVRVRGLKMIQAKEIVEYYFENRRRSGGGPIKSFVPVESDGDSYDITFENTKDAKSVVERRHVINGLSVGVTLLHKDSETQFYRDRFLIKGLQENISDEFLLYFIKAVTGMKPKFLAFHKTEKDVVLVIMKYDLDIAQLIEHWKDETLEGAKIQIYEVEVSNVIHVSNLPENIHSDTILLYFENKRKSKGGTVKNVIRLDKASCLVYFEDYKVTESVFGHAHVFQSRDLTVRKYFKCVAQTEDEAFSTNIPQAVVIPDLDIRVLRFMQQNEKFKQIVEQELLSHHAQIDWPKKGSDSCEVSINCIVDESKVLSNRVILRWEKKIREVFKFLMDKIYVHCITLIGEYNLDDSCVECTAENKENMLVLLDKGKSMITFVGTSPRLVSTLRSEDNFSGDAEEEFKLEKLFLAHAVEFKMLRSLGYREKIATEVPHICIKESKDDLAVELEGHLFDVRKAKLIMLDIKNEFKTVFFYPLSALSSNLYSKLPIVDFVNKRLQYAGLDCIWSVSHTKLIICCHNKYDSEICMDVIKASVIDDVIHQHTNKVDSCDMRLVEKKMNEIEEKYQGKVAISLTVDNEIHLCSTKDIREVILEEFRAIIQKQKETNAYRSK
ncbi:protein mono-ADP-ribosyltransferase PARP14-like, partial [Ruditapes philippinarum]|uniref:protein mono-ADP-ribosyltransferase PARP14-like n=1 Tax=Ruditapes philippinarum TaxID=129788 RepID=UPI00295AF6F3